ncbi:uncharacterized protein N0V89_001018 [Didymosphaeria variabile]|uniref:Uncharacterized protein n=1 Tax=Didymosphaeria variabile TaxID=1932322 RepID=A0A9W9CGD3_9PLEO|nr:uncharacterized protein N0V89_001018 [Didymosphaeria variabile]KAJ4360455.1 hypothetical protein N0V89_001018 [Didymosphaeria variabile]
MALPFLFLKFKDMYSDAKGTNAIQLHTSRPNLHAPSIGDDYVGHITLESYDTKLCAANCREVRVPSIDIFFKRGSTVTLGNDCGNPASTALIKCTFQSTSEAEAKANNEGSTDHRFHRIIAGSNVCFNPRAIDLITEHCPSTGPEQSFEYREFLIAMDKMGFGKSIDIGTIAY